MSKKLMEKKLKKMYMLAVQGRKFRGVVRYIVIVYITSWK
jgi:hypothetical protein